MWVYLKWRKCSAEKSRAVGDPIRREAFSTATFIGHTSSLRSDYKKPSTLPCVASSRHPKTEYSVLVPVGSSHPRSPFVAAIDGLMNTQFAAPPPNSNPDSLLYQCRPSSAPETQLNYPFGTPFGTPIGPLGPRELRCVMRVKLSYISAQLRAPSTSTAPMACRLPPVRPELVGMPNFIMQTLIYVVPETLLINLPVDELNL